jgi:hypothetical protein
MRYESAISCAGNSPSDDELDQLFSHLERFEPPADFVDRVMADVLRLPLPQFISPSRVDGDGCFVDHRQSIPQ